MVLEVVEELLPDVAYRTLLQAHGIDHGHKRVQVEHSLLVGDVLSQQMIHLAPEHGRSQLVSLHVAVHEAQAE